MLGLHEPRADVVHLAVVRFAHEAVHGADEFISGLRERPLDHALEPRAHVERIRKDDRRFDVPELLHLRVARHLAEGVAEEDPGGNLLFKDIARMRANRGNARVHAGGIVLEGYLTHKDAVDVRNGIEAPRRENAEFDSEIAGAA